MFNISIISLSVKINIIFIFNDKFVKKSINICKRINI